MVKLENLGKLHRALVGAGLLIDGIDCNGVISWQEGHPTGTDEADAQAIIDAHDPTDYMAIRQSDAITGMENIPGWATLSPQEAEQYIIDNVTDLASAKLVLRKMVLMLFYLKDAIYPRLRD